MVSPELIAVPAAEFDVARSTDLRV